MNVDQAKLNEYNMVVVFRELRFTQVLTELARRLLPEHPSPLITEIPSRLLSVVYPDRGIDCQFANRRVQVRDKRGGIPGENPFPVIALNAIEAASQSSGGHEGIVAYGFNYTLHLREGQAANYLSARFFSNATKISQAFAGELRQIGFVAAISIPERRCLAKLTLMPVADAADLIEVVVNYHYEGQSPPLLSQGLTQQTATQYDEFLRVLREI